MEAKDYSQKKPRGKASKKIIRILLGFFIGLFVFVFFLLPAALSSNKGRQIVLSKINDAVDGQTDGRQWVD